MASERQIELSGTTLNVLLPPDVSEDAASSRKADDAILVQVGKGDRDAFVQFYNRFSAPIFSMLLEMLQDRAEAEDALLEGMEEIWRRAPRFNPERSGAFTWTVMLFRSRSIDRLRKRTTRKRTLDRLVDEKAEPVPETEDFVERREERDLVRRVVADMGAEKARLLHMAFFEGWTHQEIADKTGKPLGTVKTIIRRALIDLRTRMGREGYER